MLSPHLTWDMASTRWSADINPVLALPQNNGTIIKSVTLTAGTPTVVNTLLQRKVQGWVVTDISTDATVWRTQPLNSTNLTLNCSADCIVDLWVF